MITVSSSASNAKMCNNVSACTWLVVIWSVSLLTSSAKAQENYCAFEVHVNSPVGKPVSGVPVALLRSDKTTYVESVTGADGTARLCDAPLQTVFIVAGVDVCGSVMVRNLRPTWPQTKEISVTYARESCPHFTFCDECEVLLRVHDEEGKPVAGARFDGNVTRMGGGMVSDRFGRLFRLIKRGQTLTGTVSKEGRRSAQISVPIDDNKEISILLPAH
jgi:hypothetical protein